MLSIIWPGKVSPAWVIHTCFNFVTVMYCMGHSSRANGPTGSIQVVASPAV